MAGLGYGSSETLTGVDIKAAAVHAEDPAAKDILGHVNHESIKLIMFGDAINAQWAADRILKKKSTPPLQGEIHCNRNAFSLEVGDPFKLNLPDQNINNTVFRVMNIRESDLDSEVLIFAISEDVEYTAQKIEMPVIERDRQRRDYSLSQLQNVFFMECPYAILGEEKMRLIPLVPRKKGTEVGYLLYFSPDGGTSYIHLQTIDKFTAHALTLNEMSVTVDTLDTQFGLSLNFDVDLDGYWMDTITRPQMFAGNNFAVLYTNEAGPHEIINFQTVNPAATTGQFAVTGFVRGRWDTKKRTWPVGTHFHFLGRNIELVQNENFLVGTTKYFKVIPYNSKYAGNLSGALAFSHTFHGRAWTPYIPSNLRANGDFWNAGFTASEGIQLTWSPRVRGYDAGINDPDSITDAAPTHEGFFKVEAYVGTQTSPATTISSLATYQYTFSEATLASLVPAALSTNFYYFKVYNYITTDSITYTSRANTVGVSKE